MDRAWAVSQLEEFKRCIEVIHSFSSYSEDDNYYDSPDEEHEAFRDIADRLLTMDPVMRSLMEAAQLNLGNYAYPSPQGLGGDDPDYWWNYVRPMVLRAIGIHKLDEEARRRMRPDSPDLVADQFHSWVWDAAMPLWLADSRQEAIQAAARSVNARLQQKLGRRDIGETALCREAFSLKEPGPNRPRLRFPGDRSSETWHSRQQGGSDFGAGCFEGIRNPASHEHDLNLSEMVALEYLAAFSILARWIEECDVDQVDSE